MHHKLRVYLLLFLTVMSVGLMAQNDAFIDEKQWEEMVSDYEYETVDREEADGKTKGKNVEYFDDYERNSNRGSEFSLKDYRYIVMAFILILFCVVIYFIIRNADLESTSLSKRKKIYQSVVEDDAIHELDLEALLKKAEQDKAYNLAVRIRFLMIIRELSNMQIIDWQPEKTNRMYARELVKESYHKDFVRLVRLYENVWFGEQLLQEVVYRQLVPVYHSFNQSVSQNEKG